MVGRIPEIKMQIRVAIFAVAVLLLPLGMISHADAAGLKAGSAEKGIIVLDGYQVVGGKLKLIGTNGRKLQLKDGAYAGPGGVKLIVKKTRISSVAGPRGIVVGTCRTVSDARGRLMLIGTNGRNVKLKDGSYTGPGGVSIVVSRGFLARVVTSRGLEAPAYTKPSKGRQGPARLKRTGGEKGNREWVSGNKMQIKKMRVKGGRLKLIGTNGREMPLKNGTYSGAGGLKIIVLDGRIVKTGPFDRGVNRPVSIKKMRVKGGRLKLIGTNGREIALKDGTYTNQDGVRITIKNGAFTSMVYPGKGDKLGFKMGE